MNSQKGSSKTCAFTRGLTVLSLVLLAGCSQNGDPQTEPPTPSWPQGAIVADLSYQPGTKPVPATLATLATLGFDTVLFDARITPPPLLQQRIETAKALQLRVAIRIGSAGDTLLDGPDGTLTLRRHDISQADGLVLGLQHPDELDHARGLRSALQQANSSAVLIADIAPLRGSEQKTREISLPQGIFAATLLDDDSADTPSSTTILSRRHSAPPEKVEVETLPQWQRIRHCQSSVDPRCNEDIRQLATGFMQTAVPVTGVIEGDYWQQVYSSLIALRRSTPWIHDGQLEWYAANDEARVLAYRLTNEKRQHIVVAINVSDGHEQLPLPSGFMAVSKVRIWASYDPVIRELVTSKPIVLPARSAVVIIDD